MLHVRGGIPRPARQRKMENGPVGRGLPFYGSSIPATTIGSWVLDVMTLHGWLLHGALAPYVIPKIQGMGSSCVITFVGQNGWFWWMRCHGFFLGRLPHTFGFLALMALALPEVHLGTAWCRGTSTWWLGSARGVLGIIACGDFQSCASAKWWVRLWHENTVKAAAIHLEKFMGCAAQCFFEFQHVSKVDVGIGTESSYVSQHSWQGFKSWPFAGSWCQTFGFQITKAVSSMRPVPNCSRGHSLKPDKRTGHSCCLLDIKKVYQNQQQAKSPFVRKVRFWSFIWICINIYIYIV